MFWISEERLAERERKRQERVRRLWNKLRSWCNIDNFVDLLVDLYLILFDVLSSPILIVVRFFRYFMNKWVNGYIKRFLKWIVHKFV